MRKNIGIAALALLTIGIAHTPTFGQATNATATIQAQQLSPTSYEYSITLNNTGTTSLETFWFGWFPSYDLLPSHPTSVSSPAGWTGVDAHDTFGIASVQWVDPAGLGAGQSLSGFVFDSPDSPSVMSLNSLLGFPTQYSLVYTGLPINGTDVVAGSSATVIPSAPVPEPASLMLILGAPALLLRRKRR